MMLENGKRVWGDEFGRYPLAGGFPVEHLAELDEAYI
jgi:hypothetical protein